jgi:hydroxymethylbilane synthase
MIQWIRPDLQVVDIRGNVPTRLRKLAESPELDAIILAEAGLRRLGYDPQGQMSTEAGLVYGEIIEPEHFLPAAGQGAVGIETRVGDAETKACVEAISHHDTALCVTAERQFLFLLNAGCHTPVGVATQLLGDKLIMEAIVFDEEGHQEPKTAELAGDRANPKETAERLYQSLS